jgi:hypothetical protein
MKEGPSEPVRGRLQTAPKLQPGLKVTLTRASFPLAANQRLAVIRPGASCFYAGLDLHGLTSFLLNNLISKQQFSVFLKASYDLDHPTG